ncbi:MAG: two-component system, OmpR family, sensor histidine kinase KdpD [Actinomycetota bacterium]|nr:two-component system, OmpR family, sensor histidine kinase KdpD [Actinomycetota bacterium]
MEGARGTLRIYLGAAPGVGKTFAMLGEGHRRAERGADVVVGFVETHGREHTADAIGDLEVVPRHTIAYRGSEFTEMDVDAVLARHPKVALVDELAHTNVPGSRNEKRWQDVEELLAAGITVLSTVNIQHLESLNDVVQKITGVPQRETIPDAVVRSADQVDVVDVSPEALRRRMAHGNIYGPDKVDAALGHYFRIGNLTALRELALLWVADKVDVALQHYRHEHQISDTWETRERVMVAITGGPEGDTLIRRAARIAARSGADLLALHVAESDGLSGASPAMLATHRRLVESLGGSYHQVVGDDIAGTLIAFAHAENVTQLVLGASRRSRLGALVTGAGIGASTTRLSGDIDVHTVMHDQAGRRHAAPSMPRGLTPRRRLAGTALAVVLLPLLTIVFTSTRGSLNLSSDLLGYLLGVVVVALVGGLYPALATAVVASMLLNFYFTPPVHRWTIAERNNVFALAAFAIVAAMVSIVVELAARRTTQAARASVESEILATLAGSVLRGQTATSALLERVRETFQLSSVALLERDVLPELPKLKEPTWTVVASVGPQPCHTPAEADTEIPVGDQFALAVKGRPLAASDLRILGAFAAQAATALERQRLTDAAEAAKPLEEADRMRTALLNAVSHDLRTPLASAKAAVTSLRSRDVDWTTSERAELLATADESLDRLHRLVDNLLDMSRIQAGALSIRKQRVALHEVVPIALDGLGPAASAVELDVPDSLPEVDTDPALLERVIANLSSNALRYAPAGTPPRLSASTHADVVELRIADRGPGIPESQRDHMFTSFQRLGDTDNTTGVGLGLALSRGLTEALGGTLTPEETPGGGLTMVLALPIAAALEVVGEEIDVRQPTQR